MRKAWKQVKRNKGAPGVDGRTIDRTASLLRQHWKEIIERLMDGTYRPQPVLRGWINYFRLSEVKGFAEERARKSAYNGLGPWWNSGASHMNDAFRRKTFDNLGLVNLLETLLGYRTA